MATPRNILWVTTDHMRYDCIGAHGNSAMHTPVLDSLVRNGVSFSHCYANNPLCMPSRCSFMTGCYPTRTGVLENGHELDPAFEPVVAREFARAGYQPVQIGKLHFQGHEDHDLDPRARHAYGFEIFELSEEPGCYDDAYTRWLRGEHPDLVDTFRVPRPLSRERHRERERFAVLEAPAHASHSGWVGTQACRYLGAWGPRRRPQFLHLGFYAPHPPLNPTREMFAPYDGAELPAPARHPDDPRDPHSLSPETLREYRRHFYAMVTGVDLALGRIIEQLKAIGQFERTLIVFSSDHGDLCGDHGAVGKNTTYCEGIMRLPLLLHWPEGLGNVPRTVDALVEMVDLLPSLLELAGSPPHPLMQGRSWARPLLGQRAPAGREDVFALHGRGDFMLRTATHKYLRHDNGETVGERLFDLREDPDEFHDRAADTAHSATLAALRARCLTRLTEAACTGRVRRTLF
jgi:arylsulfatase A-like enzyme